MDTLTISATDDMPRDWSPLTLENPHDGASTIITDRYGRYLIVTPQYDRSAFPCDDDARATYETNRDAAADAFGLEQFAPIMAGGRWWLTVPIVDDDDERDALRILEDLTRAVADYPVLDDSAHDERDAAAWHEFWTDWARQDVARSVADELGRRGAGYLAELIYWEDLPINEIAAHEGMAYYYGLRGEYDHDGAVDGAMLAALKGAQAF